MNIEMVRNVFLLVCSHQLRITSRVGPVIHAPPWLAASDLARWFRLSAEQFDAISFAGIVFFKTGIILFNLVPCISLHIVD